MICLCLVLLLVTASFIAGCTESGQKNPDAGELKNKYLENAGKIEDYQSEYHSKKDGLIFFDWKKPSEYRMEYRDSTKNAPGTLLLMNKTTAVRYDAEENTYRIMPEIAYLPRHDYQNMIRRAVRDEKFTITDTVQADERMLYNIEILTEPWSDKYTDYISSKICAQIDPQSGLAWNITTYYPSDTLNDIIEYKKIEVNTGIPEERFSFSPPSGSGLGCESKSPLSCAAGKNDSDRDCTEDLLTQPIGGFSGNRFLIALYNYDRAERISDPDPSGSVNYTFYSRNMEPGIVKYEICRVAGLYEATPLPLPRNFTVAVEPREFAAEPGKIYTSEVTVHLQPESEIDNLWLYLHADVEGAPGAVTDDWVRVSADDGTPMSGAGLWHFYQGKGEYCQDLLVVSQGESGHAQFHISTGELDTGTVTMKLKTVPCSLDHGPVGEDERPPWPEGIDVSVKPERFTARSFADYYIDMIFSVDSTVKPGDYCFSVQLRTPTGGFDYSAFTLRVIRGEK
ncbi:LolA family protein [Methanoplanus limicola]|uniref:LolA family protein n=1 Tax=Methanoplanus limicola TaxID=2315 RepID=UPI0012F69DBE|nr:hypothetical protein [Methanoplanus limicola]